MIQVYNLICISITILLLSACSSKNLEVHVKEDSTPLWVKHPESLASNRAIGQSTPNFRGMYIQHLNATNRAKAELSHSIKTSITSKYERKAQLNNTTTALHVKQNIEAISKALLKESYQIDAYIDEDNTLYVLLETASLADEVNEIIVAPLKTEAYSNTSLLESRCYPQKILEYIQTKADVYKEKPLWFYRPDGSVVGIAEKSEGMDFNTQKAKAITLAKSTFINQTSSQIDSSYELLKILNEEKTGGLTETSNRVKSSHKIGTLKLQDIWMDHKNCDLYVLMSQ